MNMEFFVGLVVGCFLGVFSVALLLAGSMAVKEALLLDALDALDALTHELGLSLNVSYYEPNYTLMEELCGRGVDVLNAATEEDIEWRER
jgi:hypothetical protein